MNKGAVHTLVCLPPAGASSAYFRGWQAAAGERLRIMTPELPGRQGRFSDPPLHSISAMAEEVRAALAVMPSEAVFSLFGHSMGALVAYEVTRLLEGAGGRRPRALLVSAHRPPGWPRRPQPRFRRPADVARYFASVNGRPAPPELIELMLPTIRADLEACANYAHRHQRPLKTPIAAYGAMGDMGVPAIMLGGWRALTVGGFRQRLFPGDHGYLARYAREVIDDIVACGEDNRGEQTCSTT